MPSESGGRGPISTRCRTCSYARDPSNAGFTSAESCRAVRAHRSEEHTSELQSRFDLVCRLLLEKKKQNNKSSEFIICHFNKNPATHIPLHTQRTLPDNHIPTVLTGHLKHLNSPLHRLTNHGSRA